MLIYRESLSFLFLAHVGLLAHLAHTLYMYNPSHCNVDCSAHYSLTICSVKFVTDLLILETSVLLKMQSFGVHRVHPWPLFPKHGIVSL